MAVPEDWEVDFPSTRPVSLEFEYVDEGAGWFHVNVRAGPRSYRLGGSSYATQPIDDLLRAGLALAADAWSAELWFDAEPALTRITFERVLLNDQEWTNDWIAEWGCRFIARSVDPHTRKTLSKEIDELCFAPINVARSIYAMAKPQCEDREAVNRPFAALGAVLDAVWRVRDEEGDR